MHLTFTRRLADLPAVSKGAGKDCHGLHGQRGFSNEGSGNFGYAFGPVGHNCARSDPMLGEWGSKDDIFLKIGCFTLHEVQRDRKRIDWEGGGRTVLATRNVAVAASGAVSAKRMLRMFRAVASRVKRPRVPYSLRMLSVGRCRLGIRLLRGGPLWTGCHRA